MPSRVEGISKPIFIVGSGRSGSTILTWCLGQHPNIIPQEGSNWLGLFALDAAVAYERGTARGERGQLSANFIERDEFLSHLGETINASGIQSKELLRRFAVRRLRARRSLSWTIAPKTGRDLCLRTKSLK